MQACRALVGMSVRLRTDRRDSFDITLEHTRVHRLEADALAVLLFWPMCALLAEVLVSHRPSKVYSFVRFEIILIAVV